jgi:hypothetical protein
MTALQEDPESDEPPTGISKHLHKGMDTMNGFLIGTVLVTERYFVKLR